MVTIHSNSCYQQSTGISFLLLSETLLSKNTFVLREVIIFSLNQCYIFNKTLFEMTVRFCETSTYLNFSPTAFLSLLSHILHSSCPSQKNMNYDINFNNVLLENDQQGDTPTLTSSLSYHSPFPSIFHLSFAFLINWPIYMSSLPHSLHYTHQSWLWRPSSLARSAWHNRHQSWVHRRVWWTCSWRIALWPSHSASLGLAHCC